MKDKTEDIEHSKCCAKCRYFEKRTQFCRYNPPAAVVIVDRNGQQSVQSVFSKISMPQIDWCQKFESNML